MMNSIMKSVLALLFFAALTVCSATRAGEQKPVEEILAERNQKIVEELRYPIAPNVHGWQNVNNRNVVLEDVQSKLYLVELNKSCHVLESATSITLGRPGRRIYKNDSIIVSGEEGRRGTRGTGYCQIKAIYRLENTASKTDSTN